MTPSGYSGAAWLWDRGTPLESATLLFEAEANDMGVFVATEETAAGPVTVVARLITIFDTEYSFLEGGSLVRLDIPSDAQMTLLGDQLVLQLVSDWTVDGHTYPEGSVVIQANNKSSNKMLVTVMDAARQAGVYNVSIAAQE